MKAHNKPACFHHSASHVKCASFVGITFTVEWKQTRQSPVEQLLSKTSSARQQAVIGSIRSALVTARTMDCFAHSLHKCRWTIASAEHRGGRATTPQCITITVMCSARAASIRGLPARFIRIRPALLAEPAPDNGVSIKPAPDDKFE